jgi:RNA-binding protein 39
MSPSISRRCPLSKHCLFSIGYVEFRTIELVEKAIALKGTVVMGLPIMVQLTESERNKLHPGDG